MSSHEIPEVEHVVRAFAECWNRHDMDALAELFAPDAEFVNVVGLWWHGRAEIKRAHQLTHATLFRDSRLSLSDIAIRFPASGIALARCRWVLEGHVSPDGAPLPRRTGLLLHVLARTHGAWHILDSQNTDILEGELSRPQ